VDPCTQFGVVASDAGGVESEHGNSDEAEAGSMRDRDKGLTAAACPMYLGVRSLSPDRVFGIVGGVAIRDKESSYPGINTPTLRARCHERRVTSIRACPVPPQPSGADPVGRRGPHLRTPAADSRTSSRGGGSARGRERRLAHPAGAGPSDPGLRGSARAPRPRAPAQPGRVPSFLRAGPRTPPCRPVRHRRRGGLPAAGPLRCPSCTRLTR
jgi:hypothetical protein